jgi:hypothetical protein
MWAIYPGRDRDEEKWLIEVNANCTRARSTFIAGDRR